VEELLLSAINDIRMTEIHVGPSVPKRRHFHFDTITEKLKKYKSESSIDQIHAELIQAGGKVYILRSTDLFCLEYDIIAIPEEGIYYCTY
jgi:hypothetical protein